MRISRTLSSGMLTFRRISSPRVLEVIARWRAVQLTGLARHNFACRAAAMPWDADQPVTRLLNPDALLAPARYGDLETGLLTTFNFPQEHLLRRSLRYSGHI